MKRKLLNFRYIVILFGFWSSIFNKFVIFLNLQIELDLMKTSRNKLEEELLSKQNHIQQFQIVEKQYNSKVSELEYEILTKEKALASSEKLLDVS